MPIAVCACRVHQCADRRVLLLCRLKRDHGPSHACFLALSFAITVSVIKDQTGHAACIALRTDSNPKTGAGGESTVADRYEHLIGVRGGVRMRFVGERTRRTGAEGVVRRAIAPV